MVEAVNYFFESLALDVSPSFEYICVHDNYFCLVLTDANIVLIEPSFLRREVTIDRYHQWKGNLLTSFFDLLKNNMFFRGWSNGRGWQKWSLKTIEKGEGWSKTSQIERNVTINLCSLMFLLQDFTIGREYR